ncbi:MAG: hypothetical protein OXU27_03945 [Candidatus Poribacteria bacterium]|nr:hypothetical protein [Candidatus Poribacteria bacterium]MDE0286435.1 hypothetical protein [Gammaproteobacteria bacterium]
MTLDTRITQAINEAVEEAGQSEMLARRLVAWFEAVTSGIEDINDQAEAGRHLEVLYEGTTIQDDDVEGDI